MDNAVQIITREKLLAFEEANAARPQIECPVTHRFAPGIYAREMFIPKGTCLTGKIHKFAHFSVVSKGRIAVYAEGQSGPVMIEAPFTFVSQPGDKRIGLALEDTIWTTFHPTDETDPEAIEKLVTADTYEEFEALGFAEAMLCLSQ